jgi:hypothetical protein
MNRPFGVVIIAILALLSGLWGCLVGLFFLGVGFGAVAMLGTLHPVAGAVVGGLAGVAGIIILINALFTLGFSYGAWTLKPWAWLLGVATQWATIIWSLLVALGPGSLRRQAGHLIIAILVLAYLKSPEVKRAFGRS